MSLANLRNKLLVSLALGIVVVFGLMVYADFAKMLEGFERFQWQYLPIILGLTLLNYLLRYVKWHFYLGLIGAGQVSRFDSFLMFFSGLSMVMTPGKVGEWLKSYLLRQIAGTPISKSAPIIVAERLTDGVALLILAAGGLVVFKVGWEVLLFVLLLAAAIVAISQRRDLALKLLSLGERTPILAKRMHHLHQFYESSYILLRGRNLAIAIALGFVSWSGECIAFYFVLVGLGVAAEPMLLITASFILAAATLAGSVFLLPGGLGVAEGGITGLAQILIGMPKDLAAVATLLIRFCTLWFGVSLGVITLFVITKRLGNRQIDYRREDVPAR
ncbi:MAG: lysylphosphatidylglycerol synthase transmembrane domain-containing protein [Dehalococcoidia bacterium]|nr:lysylphosphatidylglycerol synthase transmembrane domain-containing protein [Dehalococcoidia bacterium]